MKKFTSILMAMLFLAGMNAFSQDCSGVKESTDAFTKAHIKKAEIAIGSYTSPEQLTIEQRDTNYFLGMRIYQNGYLSYVMSKGEKILIKLENEKIVEIVADKDYLPVALQGAGVATIWVPYGACDIKMIKRLAHSPIVAVKVTLQGTDVLLPPLKDKQKQRVMDAAGCILGEKPQD